MTALDAATDDLAYLITHIHVDTTPGSTPNGSSRALSPRSTPGGIFREEVDSPLRGSTLRRDGSSIGSLRPYYHRNMPQPAPTVPPPAVPVISTGASTSRLIGKQIKPWPKSGSNSEIKPTNPHRSTAVPTSRDIASPAPDAEPVPVVRPLRPARARVGDLASLGKRGLREQAYQEKPPLSPLTESSFEQQGSNPTSSTAFDANAGLPIAPDVKRVLGMTGTMGTSVGALGDDEKLFDADDLDSDIPEELQAILAETAASRTESPLQAIPQAELPVIAEPQVPTFLVDHAGDNDNGSSSDEDTKKSFDFTDELRKLNESGASDRASFVEQLENAFRTPARIDLCSDFLKPEPERGQDASRAPPLAELPPPPTVFEVESTKLECEAASCCIAETWDASQPALVDTSNLNDLPSNDQAGDTPPSPTRSKRNDGHLNTAFKFGNPTPPSPQYGRTREKPLTLSNIIPPISPAFDSSGIIEEDSEILSSIYARAITDLPPTPPVRLDSDSCSKQLEREVPILTGTTIETLQTAPARRAESSFPDADTGERVGRSFDFSQHRAPFYPLRPAAPRNRHGRQASGLTIATNSSYGACITLGSKDPFEYGLPLLEGHSSEDTSDATSSSVDDTFAFLRRDLHSRRRTQSDASTFSFRPSAGPRQTTDKLAMFLGSQDPPYSSQAVDHALHRRRDSSSSEGSIALSYAMYGAKRGCAAWARHNRQESSPDSLLDEFSMLELGRPGLGEKMLDSSHDSPPSPNTSTTSHRSSVDRPSWDCAVNDSILGGDEARLMKAGLSPQPRLLSTLSTESEYDPSGEDETIFNVRAASLACDTMLINNSDVGRWTRPPRICQLCHHGLTMHANVQA
jgi:serine/arginine repetitive matrix protein 2